jgi:hypothetical protein
MRSLLRKSLTASLLIFIVLARQEYCVAQEGEKQIFEDTFEDGIDGLEENWKVITDRGDIESVESNKSGKCIKISRQDRNGFTYISRDFSKYKGSLRFEATIQAEQVATGAPSYLVPDRNTIKHILINML